ncbi:MAG TPA: polysaccharide biosynthesis C-terminal domain-containing protein, partial [Nonomuraea sp.]|nr:polysaccharide biosynthesis C-terminal domain-containing protein [Nonomuraea sp.]
LVVYGAQWNPAAGVLRWLAVMMVIRMMLSLALDILTGQGDTRATVWMNLAYGVVLMPALVAGAHLDGIRGTAVGQVVAASLVALPVAASFLHRAGVRLGPVAPSLVRPLLAAAAAAAVTALLDRLVDRHPVLELLLAGSAGLIVYVALVVPPARLRHLSGRLRRKEVG